MKYFDVHFRIRSAYQGYSGFANDEQSIAFYKEVRDFFTSNGWRPISEKNSGKAFSVKKDKQELYLHPMDFSGVISEESIDHLYRLLSADTHQTFRCEHVDVYEEYMDMTDEEYLSLLHAQESEIEAALLAACRTKRKNLYAVGNMTGVVSRKFSVPRLGQRPRYDKEHIVVREVFNRLTRTGAIEVATTKSGVGYRTTMKKESAA